MSSSPTAPTRPQVRRGRSGGGVAGNGAGLVTTILVGLILVAAPSVLGAARLWYELPLLGGIALLLAFQALRLATPAAPGRLRPLDAIDFSVLLFVGYTIVRWLTSPTEYFSRLEALNVVGYATIFLTCRHGLGRRSHGLALVMLLAVMGVGETAFGYYLSRHSDINNPSSLWFPFGPTEQLQLHYAPRWLGTYGCPDHYASLLVMAAAAALALGCFSKLPWPLRIVFFYGAAVLLVGIIFSGSRGGWLSLLGALAALTFFALRYGTLRWWVPIGGIVLFIAVLGGVYASSPFVQERVEEVTGTIEAGQVSLYVRVQLAKDALHIAHDYPLLGTGPGTFVFIHPRYQSSTFGFKAQLTHDDYLNCLDDYGLVGFALAMFFVFAVTLTFLARVRGDFRWPDRVLFATGFLAWSALLVHSLLDFNLHIPANAMVLFAFTGLALRRPPDPGAPRPWSTLSLAPLGRGLGVALLLFALAEMVEITRTAGSDIVYEKFATDAETAPAGQSIQGMNEALAWDCGNAQAWLLLGDLYRVQALHQKDFPGRVEQGEKALAAYQRAFRANPLDDTIQARRGLTYDIMRRYAEAYLCFKAAVTAEPYDGQFWSALGNHFWESGRLLKAAEAYHMASQCPHGSEGSAESAAEVDAILQQEGVKPPAPGMNPLLPQPPPEESATIP